MNPAMNSPEPFQPPAASSKRSIVLCLTAIGMGFLAALFLLTRPRIEAPVSNAGCSACGATNSCEMRAAPSNATNPNTQRKTSGVSHE